MNVVAYLAPALQQNGGETAAPAIGGLIVGIFAVVCLWMVFVKAGEPGWYAVIPIWNVLSLLRIAGRPWWWILLLLIPGINIVVSALAMISLGRSFGRSTAFSVLLLFFCQVIGLAILAFGNSRYEGPGGRSA